MMMVYVFGVGIKQKRRKNKMTYEIKAHLGQQMENFLNAFAGADVEGMLRIKEIFVDLYKNINEPEYETAVSTINGWDKEKLSEIEKIRIKIVEDSKKLSDTKTLGEFFFNMDRLRESATQAVGELEGEYWSRMKSFFVKTVTK
jgi:hypothetical protein